SGGTRPGAAPPGRGSVPRRAAGRARDRRAGHPARAGRAIACWSRTRAPRPARRGPPDRPARAA
ncbi:MAG: hypothetical protein E6K37_02150, partial [Gammaproteobacteria bacterium]